MQKIKDVEYIYASSRIKAAEGNGTFNERMNRAIDAQSVSALYHAVLDFGIISESRKSTAVDLTSALNEALSSAVDLVVDSVPNPNIYNFLLYKYDCANIKTAVKESILNKDYGELYFDCGTVGADEVKKIVKERDFSSLPQGMAKSASIAYDIYEQTGETRSIDIMIDCGCFEDIKLSAQSSGVPFFEEIASMDADITNIKTSVRLSEGSLKPETAKALMERAFVVGGTIPQGVFIDSSDGSTGAAGVEAIYEKMDASKLKSAIADADSSLSAAAALEKCYIDTLSQFEYKAFGPEIPAVFLLMREREIRNLRIISALISKGGIKKEKIRERIGIR